MSNKLNVVGITEIYDFSIEGAIFHNFRKMGIWNNFTEFRDPEGRLIIAFDPPVQPVKEMMNLLFKKEGCPGEMTLVSASPDILKEIENQMKEEE